MVELIETTKKDANPHIRTLHNIIGNFFKPSAVLAALGGTTSIQNYVQGNQWSSLPPEQVELKFTELRNYVLSATTNLPTLHPHIVSRWFPSMVTKLESPDTWHKSLNMQTPPVSTCALSTSPPLPMDSPIDIPLPLSLKAATLLYTHDCLSVLIPHSVFATYPLSSLLSNSLPHFSKFHFPYFLPHLTSNNFAFSLPIFEVGNYFKHANLFYFFMKMATPLSFTPLVPFLTLTSFISFHSPPRLPPLNLPSLFNASLLPPHFHLFSLNCIIYGNSLSLCKFTFHFYHGFLLLLSSIISLPPLLILNSISLSPPPLFRLPYHLYLYYAIFLPFSLPLLINPCGRPPLQQDFLALLPS